MTFYMLDTNTVSLLLRKNQAVLERLRHEPPSHIFISSITRAELIYGLAKRPQAVTLKRAVDSFLLHVETKDWDSGAAENYGRLRAKAEAAGISLSPLDMLIAAHANAMAMILVTNDQAIHKVPDLIVEDWSK